jgi:hypothetical protein
MSLQTRPLVNVRGKDLFVIQSLYHLISRVPPLLHTRPEMFGQGTIVGSTNAGVFAVLSKPSTD